MNNLDLAQCQRCAGFNLRRATRAISRLYDEILRPSGLQGTQYSLLVTIAVAGPAPINQIADLQVMDRTTLTRNLKPLEKKGLIEITPGEDQRTRLVALTDLGQETLAQMFPLWQQAHNRVTEMLGTDRFNSLLGDLSAIVELAG
jgi:DNA-binding MarR family transcriptional regulator